VVRAVVLNAYEAGAKASAEALLAADPGPPNELRIIFDVDVVLRDACVAGGANRDELKDDWQPDKAGLKRVAWGMCLSDFADRIVEVNPAYGDYAHDTRFTDATFKKGFAGIRDYLVKKVKAVLK
jgi:hypothetical protein